MAAVGVGFLPASLAETTVPRVVVDKVAVGSLAAEHLHERGFHNLAYYGIDVEYSSRRLKGFTEALAICGFAASQLILPPTYHLQGCNWLDQQQALIDWLITLKTPCGIFCVSNARAIQLIHACRQLALDVPDEVAVIDVDEQRMIWEHSSPTISSVAWNHVDEGYQAASLLDQLMRGKHVPQGDHLIAPEPVIARDSTATFAVSNARLRDAMIFIRRHIEEPFTIADVCRHVRASRRWLEYSFRDAFGETPHQYIQRQRIECAERLLIVEPTAKIYNIAQRAGFSSAKQLSKVFRREYGIGPRHFRQSMV